MDQRPLTFAGILGFSTLPIYVQFIDYPRIELHHKIDIEIDSVLEETDQVWMYKLRDNAYRQFEFSLAYSINKKAFFTSTKNT